VVHAKYVHTNLSARDWRKLAAFYTDVFGCTFVPPERDYQGTELDRGTGLTGAHLRGAHFRLPSYGDSGPTLEIYSYDTLARATLSRRSTVLALDTWHSRSETANARA
jgi:hypothetical protein